MVWGRSLVQQLSFPINFIVFIVFYCLFLDRFLLHLYFDLLGPIIKTYRAHQLCGCYITYKTEILGYIKEKLPRYASTWIVHHLPFEGSVCESQRMLHIRQFICNNKHLSRQGKTQLWNTTGDKTMRVSPINIMTEGRGLTRHFSFNLFGLLMTGYQIPISLSCSFPSSAPCCSLEDCFGEHLEAGCWIGFFLAGPCAPASILRAWILGHSP